MNSIEDKAVGEIFQYFIVFVMAVWTARLAKAKGRSPWAWGGAALLLGLIPPHLFGAVPVAVLLFVKLPATSPGVQVDRLTCARCARSYSDGQHFCTGCGWDLNEAYSPEESDEGQPFPARTQVQTTVPSTAVAKPPETADAAAVETPATEVPVSEAVTSDAAAPATVETPQESSDEPEQAAEAAPGDASEEPDKEHVPWGTFDPGVAPTATVMTSRGIERFDEGKYQEAIDQFTKAIALDANYKEAWERRAEAYATLGRDGEAEEDRRRLNAINPSSSTG
ncbi:MAG: tetratricopeptide repeat protein [Chloroflexi bacterium]|nr:tetratricopeptide repeat protein [Chloroflexota bacterium]